MKAGLDYRWDDVRIFLAVIRERTLTGASVELGIDASTVSRKLTAFEEMMGAQLFDRTRDGLLATAAAERLLAAAEELEAAALRLSRAAEELEASPRGLVRLAVTPGVAESFAAPFLLELYGMYPELRVELDASPAVADLTRREADIAIRTVRPTGGDLVMTKLMSFHYAVLASPAYAAELGTLVDPAAARWIGWGRDLGHIPSARWLNRHAGGVEPVLRTGSIGAQLVAVDTGLGVAVLPGLYRALRGLVSVPLGGAMASDPLPSEDVWLVGHRALRDVPRIAAAWRFLVEIGKRAPT